MEPLSPSLSGPRVLAEFSNSNQHIPFSKKFPFEISAPVGQGRSPCPISCPAMMPHRVATARSDHQNKVRSWGKDMQLSVRLPLNIWNLHLHSVELTRLCPFSYGNSSMGPGQGKPEAIEWICVLVLTCYCGHPCLPLMAMWPTRGCVLNLDGRDVCPISPYLAYP